MNRRRFLGTTAVLASSSALASSLPVGLASFLPGDEPDLVVHTCQDYFSGVRQAIDYAGGISRFIPSRSSIGILINSAFDIRAAYVKPEISLGLIELLMETDPKEIILLQAVSKEYWDSVPQGTRMEMWGPLVTQVSTNVFPATYNEEDFMILPSIPGALHLKEAEMVRRFAEVDAFINVPLIKHHNLTLLTGALKNMMGVLTRKTNVTFHLGSGVKNDPAYLSECISDINLYRKPDLVVADATELIITNGPAGPGDTIQPNKILAGKDPVIVDAYGATIMGYLPEDILAVVKAHEAGLGEMDLAKAIVLETSQKL